MTVGRKRKPTALKLLQGNPGKRKIQKDDIVPDICIPDPPPHLDAGALEEWGRITVELERLGMMSQIDKTAIAAYCVCYSRWQECERNIQEKGMLLETSNGNIVQSPYVGMANKALLMIHKFCVEYGMTAASRTRISTPAKKKDKSEWED